MTLLVVDLGKYSSDIPKSYEHKRSSPYMKFSRIIPFFIAVDMGRAKHAKIVTITDEKEEQRAGERRWKRLIWAP